MKQYLKDLIDKDTEFLEIINELITNDTVLQMKNYLQHYETTCYEHCLTVSYYCYLICKKYNLDYKSAARAGMLHDLFLYNWRERQPDRKGFHAFTHGKTACENACKLFELNDKEKDMIINHMWPVTLYLPKSIEGIILTFVDKYSAMSESFEVLKSRLFMRKAFRYTYAILSLMIIKF